MSKQIQRRRGSNNDHAAFVGAQGEFTYNTDTKRIVAHDGLTAGGFPAMRVDELGATGGSALVGYDGGTVQAVLDTAKPISDYVALRAYTGRAAQVRITTNGIAGFFYYDANDTTSVDNGGTIIVSSNGKRWKRLFDGTINVLWFMTIAQVVDVLAGTIQMDVTTAILSAISAAPSSGCTIVIPQGRYLFSSTLNVNKPVIIKGSISGVGNNVNVGSVLVKSATLNGSGITLNALGAKLQDITLQGVTGNGGDGVVMIESRCILEDVAVFNMGQDGVRIGTDAAPNNANLWVIRNLKSKNNTRDGLRISSKIRPTLPDANAGVLTMADLQSNGACGIYLGNCGFNTFVGLCCQTNGTYGLYSSSSSYENTFYGGDFEVNGRPQGSSSTNYADFFIEAGSKANRVIGISCYNFPVSFVNNEPDNFIISANDGIFEGSNKYAGINLRNVSSDVPTVLDWYKEGTFVPAIAGSTSAGTATYTGQQGHYTRIGNVVKFHIYLAWSGHTGTGNMSIAGLPFASTNTTFQPVEVFPSAITSPAGTAIKGMVPANSLSVSLYSVLIGGDVSFSSLALDAAGSLWVNGSYEVQ